MLELKVDAVDAIETPLEDDGGGGCGEGEE